MGFFSFLAANFYPLLGKLLQQIYITFSALFIAITIGLPVGIIIARRPKVRTYVLAFNNLLQTLPSLAVLGFLLPFLGIGFKTAVVAVVLYTMLPIIRNTVTGLLSVGNDLLEAAKGLGFTAWQRLHRIELPLALPIIIAGIRTAVAMSVGLATLAALIGAGGFGDFIYQGLALNDDRLILLGAIPAAILALVLDTLVAKIEKIILTKKYANKKLLVYLSSFSVSIILGCLIWSVAVPKNNQIVIATKNFTEQLILGELMAELIEAKTSLHVVKKFNLGSTLVCHNALLNKEIDLYPEYTGTSYMVILKQSNLTNPAHIYHYVQENYRKKYGLEWLNQFGFTNNNALAIPQFLAAQYHVTTISNLINVAPLLTIGVPADFLQRPDGLLGLKNNYGLQFKKIQLLDPGLMYAALQLKQLDTILAFTTDARVLAFDLILLKDDKHIFPAYCAAPLIRQQIIQTHPEIVPVLNLLAGRIDNNHMRQMNYAVDIMKQSPQQVAHQFLMQQGLLRKS